jgi:hypothetical protein
MFGAVYGQLYESSMVNIIDERSYPVPLEAILITKERIRDVELKTFWTLKGAGWLVTARTFPTLRFQKLGSRFPYRRHGFELFLFSNDAVGSVFVK